MKAIILCAGYGKRMRSYTELCQKSMLPVHGKPLLEYIINGIKTTGIKDFVIVVGYLKEQIIDYFQDGGNWNINIEYIEQIDLNGTGGAILLCENSIVNQHFFLTWGDTLVSYKVYRDIYNVYKKEGQNFLLVTSYTDDPYKGAAIYCEGNYCSDIIEKPPKGTSRSNLDNTGVFIFSKEIFDVLKTLKPSERGELELPEALRIGIKERNWKVRVIKMEKEQFNGNFGEIDEYEQLKDDSAWLNLL